MSNDELTSLTGFVVIHEISGAWYALHGQMFPSIPAAKRAAENEQLKVYWVKAVDLYLQRGKIVDPPVR